MKFKTLTLALTLAASTSVMAAEPAPASSVLAGQPDKPVPQTPEAWLARMTDFTQNLSAFRDPRVFMPWLNTVTEPNFYTAALIGMQDPVGWLNMLNSMLNPNAYRNWAQFADPAITMRWIAAGVDPAFYTALTTILTDPGKAMRWALWPADPKLWGAFLNLLNPGLYLKWTLAPLDPRALTLMTNAVNPVTYLGWMGAVMDPRTYGPTWANLLTYQAASPAAQGNPWVPQTGAQAGAPLTPNAPMGLFGGFGQPAPAMPTVSAPAPGPSPAAPVTATKAPETAKPAEAPKAAEAAKPAETPKSAVTAKPAEVVAPAAAPAQPVAAPTAAVTKVVLSGDTLFALGKSGIRDLSKEGRQRLDEVAEKIKALGEVEQIKIVGHADATGKPEANRRLSEARARSVKSYLVAKGVKPSVIITSGMGDSQPVVQCDMQLPKDKLVECLAPNRRVEIEVVGKAR
ncbi:MAG: OmpA family protein [Thiobacillaceae bacterium]